MISVPSSRHCTFICSLSVHKILKFHSTPPNLQFYVDDIEDEWGYEDTPFDYIHARFLVGAILDWPKLMHQAFQFGFHPSSPMPLCCQQTNQNVWSDAPSQVAGSNFKIGIRLYTPQMAA